MRQLALIALLATGLSATSGCYGYNRSAKRGAYVLDSMFIAGGGGIVVADVLTESEPCTGTGCVEPVSPVTGAMVAGSMLIVGGLVGIVVNATRPTVKTSR